MSVSQTSVIFFGLLVGFVVYITLRGELASYLSVLGLDNSGLCSASATKTLMSQLNDSLPPLGTIPVPGGVTRPGGIPR